jgi:hypothetical protein
VWASGWDDRWHLVWVPPVTAATLSFSKTSVLMNEKYDVIVTVPAGLPIGATVQFRRSGYASAIFTTTEGQKAVTLSGSSHASRGSVDWYVDIHTVSGDTTWGPLRQTVLQAAPTAATLSFSKTPVFAGEAFNVTATIPGGVTPTMYAVFRSSQGHRHTVHPAVGAGSVTLTGMTHNAGSWDWYVDLYTEGGMKAFGPLRQTANARSTATLTSRDWVLHPDSGADGPNTYIIPLTFTVSVGTPSLVSRASLQLSWAGAPGWAEWAAWNNPSATQTHDWSPTHTGNWQARVVITHTDGVQTVSNVVDITCALKTLSLGASASGAVPVGSSVTFYPACGGDCPNWQSGASVYYTTNGSPWTAYPSYVWPYVGEGNEHWWMYAEDFPDGSRVSSPFLSITPTVPPPPPPPPSPYHVRAGYTQAEFQAVVDSRAGAQVLVEPGHYNFTSGKFAIPAGVHILSYDCTFTVHQGIVTAGSGGGYDRAGGWTWEGGTFDGGGVRTTMFSLAHAPSFTIRNVTIRGCKGKGHGIEINSSGGPVQSGYTVVIEGCVFDGVTGHRPQSEGPYKDEAIHFDYAWGASAATANPANDGTVCNNVWVKNNTVAHNPATGYPVGYPVGFGAHKFGVSTTYHPDAKKSSAGNWICRPPGPNNTRGGYEGQARPVEYHTHFLIEGNTFHVSAYAGTGKRGAIHIRGADGFVIRNNSLASPSGAAVVTYENEFTKNLSSSPAAVNI